MIQIAYTNSKTSDVWQMFNAQNRKFCSLPLYLISDAKPLYGDYDNIFLYKNEQPYWKVWTKVLEHLKPEYFIYLQEDFVLFDKVDEDKLKEYKEFLDYNKEYSFVRLIKSGNLGDNQVGNNLFEIESGNENIFSMQPTIWRTSDFLKLYNEVQEPQWLEPESYRMACIKLGLKGVYHYDNEKKRGSAHYDSNVYPYIATALVKGKWNTSEYKEELEPLLTEFNINPYTRGLF
jgi:hypothetical protein